MSLSFSQVLANIYDGKTKYAREGWNAGGMFITAQLPDEHSKMKSPYLYIDSLDSDSKVNTRVPWVPSQTDLAAADWVELKKEPAILFELPPRITTFIHGVLAGLPVEEIQAAMDMEDGELESIVTNMGVITALAKSIAKEA